ncbi:MAG: alpha-glucuronidase [Defluviitaleaceae bacterium]|nr:alpha-glucuronidase [Defluviitaleaceae bacterium]MCL2835564.1 alpha-glucuronidase [Defluviitaleaceae bacterium]
MENFKEYYAWLQPGPVGCSASCSPMRPGRGVSLREVCVHGSEQADFAARELRGGLNWLAGQNICDENSGYKITLGLDPGIQAQGYRINGDGNGSFITGADREGLIYGVFAFLGKVGMGEDLPGISAESAPVVRKRILNHWDNMDGSVERGYSGKSLFFRDGRFCYDPSRMKDYARLLASVGINELSINNVNVTDASARLITPELLPEAAELAAIFRPFGVRLILAVDFESPVKLGGLNTADPLNGEVAAWWKNAARVVYDYIPDLAGFVVKADSEFRDGPAALGRTQADGANTVARALKDFGGTVYWRCFVYNCRQDWRDAKTDRPKAAFEHFYPLDGTFDENVVLQIKNGPVDFQVREPVSPLFGRMKHTKQAVEFQITQEYTGQQIDLYNLAVQWEEFFAAPISEHRLARDIMGKEAAAIAGVANTGCDGNWTGHLLAQANLYAFGRMAWDPGLTAKQVTSEWVCRTFGKNTEFDAITGMMLASRGVYEKYASPLGLGWMVNINHHYGPSPEGYEYMKWGTYHRADNTAVGVDRTAKGTGFAGQYEPWLEALYSDVKTCPEELLLFFHRVRYDYRLKSGKTLLQHIYDTHFEGAAEVQAFMDIWDSLKGRLPQGAYESVADRLKRQLQNALEWRDVVNAYFYRKTGVGDEMGREIYG